MVQGVSEKISALTPATGLSSAAIFPVTDGVAPALTTYRVPKTWVVPEFNVLAYGMATTATGAVNGAALQAAMTAASAARARLVVPPGTYNLSTKVLLPDGAFLDLEIQAGATLDFSQLTTLPAREAAITVGTDSGGLAVLPGLGAHANKGDNQITFASPPSLVAGDLFIIWNDDAQSWNTNLIDSRPYYHSGEYLRVRSISGSVVQLDRSLYDTYLTSENIDLVKVTTSEVKIHGGGKIVGAATALLDTGIQLWNCYRSKIEDIDITGCLYSGVLLYRCFDTELVNVNVYEASTANTNAGVLIISGFNVKAIGGNYRAGKHGFSLTGGNIASAVPNRLCGAIGATVSADTQAADMHGHCDRCFWIDCNVSGGMALGGSNCRISGGSVRSASDFTATAAFKGMCIRFREMKNCAHTIENVEVFLDHLSQQSGGDYPLSFDTFEAIEGGKVTIRNLKIRASVFNAKLLYLAIQPESTGLCEFDVDGVVYDGPAASKAPVLILFGTTAASFQAITLANMNGISPQCDTVRAKQITYRNLQVSKSDTYGIIASVVEFAGTPQFIDISDCLTRENDTAGILVSAAAAAHDVYARVSNCRSLNNGQDAGAASADKASLRALTLKSVELTNNTWGDTQGVQTQTRLYDINTVTTLTGSGNKAVGATLLRTIATLTNDFEELVFIGTATPEGVVTAPVGSLFIRKDGGAATTRYYKETGTGNTGWVGK